MKSIYFIAISAFLCATQNIYAQNILKGKITDINSKSPLYGVSIYIPDLKRGVISDFNGDYQIDDLKSGTYLFEISKSDYKSIIQQITISQDTVINFSLITAVKELTEIVVTGVSHSTDLRLSPIIIKTIGKDELNENSSTNIIDGLKNVPGVSQITSGTAISKPIIRGLGYNRVIVLNNGIRQEGQQWGDEHGVEIDEFSVDKVEIVKGPGSLMYGSDGIAGVINFISEKAPPKDSVRSQLITNYQSNNDLFAYSFSNAGNKNGLQWMSRFSNKYAGNYHNKYDGSVYNSGFKEFDGSLFLGVNKTWGHSHLHLSSYNNTLNLIEGERDSLGNFIYTNSNGSEMSVMSDDQQGYKTGFPHQVINHSKIALNNYFILKKGTISADLGFQNNKRKEFADPGNPDDIELYFDLYTFNYSIRYNLKKIKGWETSFGIGGMQQSNINKGIEFLIPAYNLVDVGGFVFTQKTFNKLTLAGGIRFDNRYMNSKELILDSLMHAVSVENDDTSVKFQHFTNNYNGISASIGLSYQASKISTIKLNLSRGFRAPNISELASNGRHEGAFRYEIGNLNLRSEISHQIDLAYFLNSDHISFELTPFINTISNYIYAEKLINSIGGDSIVDMEDPAPVFKFTQGNATLFGGEIYFDIHPHPLDWLHFENSFSFVQAIQSNQTDSTKYLPFIPAPKYRGEIKAHFKKWGKNISNAYLKFGIDHYFEQNNIYSAYNTETRTPAYTLLNAGIGADIKMFKKKEFLNLFISGENLTNTAYQSHLSRLKYSPINPSTGRAGVFNMGRNISIKMIVNI